MSLQSKGILNLVLAVWLGDGVVLCNLKVKWAFRRPA